MRKISVKLALLFIAVICISSTLAFFLSALSTQSIEKELRLMQEEMAISIQELNGKTNLGLQEIIDTIPSFMYVSRVIDNPNSYDITAGELDRIHNGEIVFLNLRRFKGSATLFVVEDSYILITLHSHHNIYNILGSRVGFTILSYVLIGAVLTIISVKRAVQPIVKLTSAMQEVAKGNFDIQLESRSKDEIGLLTKNFNRMTKELKNIEYLRKDFITNVSHEFKTPIASIQGFAKLLQKGNLSEEEQEEYTNIIVEETTRLTKLSSNVLKLSKLENQNIVESKVTFSLDEQIRKSILLLEHEWTKKNIDFDIDLYKIKYEGDEELLQQVWINLLGNAIKFSHPNGRIAISLEETPGNIRVVIKDEGIGMTQETTHRIFEKFYQGDKAHSNEGNGLGLPLVKRILDLVNGQIHLDSEINKGSTFTIVLPQQSHL